MKQPSVRPKTVRPGSDFFSVMLYRNFSELLLKDTDGHGLWYDGRNAHRNRSDRPRSDRLYFLTQACIFWLLIILIPSIPPNPGSDNLTAKERGSGFY
jgi:hypothetical protein